MDLAVGSKMEKDADGGGMKALRPRELWVTASDAVVRGRTDEVHPPRALSRGL